MLRSRIAPKVPGMLAAVLVLGFALVASADFLDRPGCSRDGRDACGSLAGGSPGEDSERQCDHCIGCFVAHGHFLSVVPTALAVAPALASIPSAQFRQAGTFEAHPAEIFHPPLGGTC
jgi:hypothetical protein